MAATETMKPTPQITPEQIDKIKAADLGNIIKKVKSGKTLSSVESKALEKYQREQNARQEMTAARMIAQGVEVMEKIKEIIAKSRLTAAEKTKIANLIASIEVE
jgi:type 1 glutamine amidotransferase